MVLLKFKMGPLIPIKIQFQKSLTSMLTIECYLDSSLRFPSLVLPDYLIGNSNFPIVSVSIYVHMRLSIHPAITCPSIPPLNICSSIYLHIYCLFHPSFPHPPVHKYLPPFISSSASATIHTSAHQSILPSIIHSHSVNNAVCPSIRLQLFFCYRPSAHSSSSAHLFTIIWFFLFLP